MFMPMPSCRWRLDRDNLTSTFVKLRAAIMALFRPSCERAARLRQLIVDLAPPEFAPPVCLYFAFCIGA